MIELSIILIFVAAVILFEVLTKKRLTEIETTELDEFGILLSQVRPPLKNAPLLRQIAQARIKEFKEDNDGHQPFKSKWMYFLASMGFMFPKECLARTANDPLKAWMRSEPHRRVILGRAKYYGFATDGVYSCLIVAR